MTPTPRQPSSSRSFRRWLAPAGIVVVLLFAVLFPLQVGRDNIWNLFFLMCLGISIGQSWNMLGGFAGQVSLGHAAFFGIGALITRTLWLAEIPFVVALIVGGLTAVAFAMVIGVPTFRLRGAYFAIGTLGRGRSDEDHYRSEPAIHNDDARRHDRDLQSAHALLCGLGVGGGHDRGCLPADAFPVESGHSRGEGGPGCRRVHRGPRPPAQVAGSRVKRAFHGSGRRRVRLPADRLLPRGTVLPHLDVRCPDDRVHRWSRHGCRSYRRRRLLYLGARTIGGQPDSPLTRSSLGSCSS